MMTLSKRNSDSNNQTNLLNKCSKVNNISRSIFSSVIQLRENGSKINNILRSIISNIIQL